jgi:hypothetical protein
VSFPRPGIYLPAEGLEQTDLYCTGRRSGDFADSDMSEDDVDEHGFDSISDIIAVINGDQSD